MRRQRINYIHKVKCWCKHHGEGKYLRSSLTHGLELKRKIKCTLLTALYGNYLVSYYILNTLCI